MDFGGAGQVTNDGELYRRMEHPEHGDTRHHKYLYDEQDVANSPILLHYRNMGDGGDKNHFVSLLAKSPTVITFSCTLDVFKDIRAMRAK
jgi:hypothetical protein